MKKNKFKQNHAITPIALIIIIILAGAVIILALNESNLFEQANKELLKQWTNGDKTGDGGATPSTLPTGWSQAAVASAYPSATATQKAPIPKGFVASGATGEKTIATGLVIYKGTEPVSDSNVATAQTSRDQYVWIPVDNSSTITWSAETEDTTKLTSNHDTTKEAALTLSEDFEAMKKSVQKYGGFYISRYELGGTASNPTSRKGQVVANGGTTSSGGLGNWYGLYDLAHQIKSLDGTTALTNVGAHMIFGSEYEEVLAFIDTNNDNYSTTGHDTKQETIKHNSGIVTQPGKELDTVKNIIDLEGNLYEWTAQACDTNSRVNRGGYCYDARYTYFYPVSSSSSSHPTGTSSDCCTRQILYVKI